MGEKLTFSAILWREGKLQIAWSPELDIASQGKNVEEALANLHEAIDLYFEDEDAKIPTNKSPILTMLSVETHISHSTTSFLQIDNPTSKPPVPGLLAV